MNKILIDEIEFLISRLEEFEAEILDCPVDPATDNLYREWSGHVSPSLERLKYILKD